MYRIFPAFVVISAILIIIYCDNSRTFSNEDDATKASIDNAIATVRAVHHACRYREQDAGKPPKSVEELMQLEYLTLDEATASQWSFSLLFEADKATKIVAKSSDKMPGGIGYEISYDRESNEYLFTKP